MENTLECGMSIWEEISNLTESLQAQLSEKKEGYVSSLNLEGDDFEAPLMIYFTKFNLKMSDHGMDLIKLAKQAKELGVENDPFFEMVNAYEYAPEEIEAFERWRDTTRLLKEKSDEFKSLLT